MYDWERLETMRKLTEAERDEVRRRCAGLGKKEALLEGGRWMCEHYVIHWTSGDIEDILYTNQKNKNKTK